MAYLWFNNVNNPGDSDWNNSGNWWDGPQDADPPPSSGFTPNTNDELTIQTNCDTNIPTYLSYYITIENGVTFTLLSNNTFIQSSYYIYCNGILNINSDNTLNIENLNIFAGGVVGNSGSLVASVPNNSGTLDNGGACTVYVASNSGNINNSNGEGSFTVTTNSGSIVCSSGTIVGNITTNNGTVNNSGVYSGVITTNNGNINNLSGAFENNGALTNNGTFNNGAILTNNAAFTNNGTFNHTAGSTFKNVVTFTNNGTTTLAATSYISLRPISSFINNGTFTYGTKYTTRFKGEIFPQVPSSASWGNALL